MRWLMLDRFYLYISFQPGSLTPRRDRQQYASPLSRSGHDGAERKSFHELQVFCLVSYFMAIKENTAH